MAGSPLNIIRPAYYCDTINGSVNPLSGLLDPSGQPISVGAACYVNNGDGSGNPAVWTCEVSTAAVDHSTVEAVANATGSRWLKSGAYGGGGGGGGGVPAGTLVTVGSDTTNVDLAVNSATDGGWEMWGLIQFNSGSDALLSLQPNADASTTKALGGEYEATLTVSGAAPVTMNSNLTSSPTTYQTMNLGVGGGASSRLFNSFYARFLYKDGFGGWLDRSVIWMATASTVVSNGVISSSRQFWAGNASAWTVLRINSSVANAIKAGSAIRYRPLGFTA